MVKKCKFLIGGQWHTSPDMIEVKNPYDGELVGLVHKGSEKDLDLAISWACQAFEFTKYWPAHRRAELLEKIAKGIEERKEEFARTITLECGKTLREAKAEVDRAIFTFKTAQEEALRIEEELIPLDRIATGEGRLAIKRRFPIGPIGGITPFNFPLNLVAHKVAPCIASGNTMVLKPASKTPMTALLLGEVMQEKGLPEGVVNIVPCSASVAERLAYDERIVKLSFTGSAEVGWALKEKAWRKKVTLELGGNAGVIIHSDADLDHAAQRCLVGGFSIAGQSCISVQRIFLHKVIQEGFMEKFLGLIKKIRMGNPLEKETDMGPMIDEEAAKRAEDWVKEALEGGAKTLIGGRREGTLIEPTILTHVRPRMKVYCQEVFAPIVCICPYDEFEEALNGVNDSRYGLQAGVFTHDMGRIFKSYQVLAVGGVITNDVPTFRIDHMPYGGVKDSGFGREGVKYAIEEMTEMKLLVLRY